MTGLTRWPGRYTDRHGSQEIVFESDGRELIRTTIRGVRFEGDTMDGLGAVGGEPPEPMLVLRDGDLWSCLLEWELPLPVDVAGRGERTASLHCALNLWYPEESEHLTLTLRLGGHELSATHPDFETALREIASALPDGTRLRACVSCAWSDYHPAGNGMMAGLACFRDVKDLYRRCDGKHGRHGIFTYWPLRTGFVQETHLCDEFEHRAPDHGYRGGFP
ncbi:DUF6304 family protein [Streptomyces sp. FZ201]|uniref:DUF6304 family protein n=1 Tax=Streptomyces sp. FZ201 TaxID=3057122 RepID=UPI0021BEED2D|nr:DUF6304 family protein [Streptomyces sp. FZ201]